MGAISSGAQYMPPQRKPLPLSVNIRGRRYAIQRTIRAGDREYGVIEPLSQARERYLVFDPAASPTGELRGLHFYPRNADTMERLQVLQRLSERDSRFPTIVSYHPQREQVAVVLHWVPGNPLEHYLERIRKRHLPRTSVAGALRMYRNVAHTLGQLYNSLNVVHGDIKPRNLVLPTDSTNLRLIDFGSAWCAERAVQQAGSGDGITWDIYASPEQRRLGLIPGFQSDMFSATVVFFELLTEQAPFAGMGGGAGASDELIAAYENQFNPPSKFALAGDATPRNIWRRIDAIASRGLALRPEGRYPGRGEWLDEIEDVFALIVQKPALSGVARAVNSLVGRVAGLFAGRSEGTDKAD